MVRKFIIAAETGCMNDIALTREIALSFRLSEDLSNSADCLGSPL